MQISEFNSGTEAITPALLRGQLHVDSIPAADTFLDMEVGGACQVVICFTLIDINNFSEEINLEIVTLGCAALLYLLISIFPLV